MNILLTGGGGFIGRNIYEGIKDSYNVFAPFHKELEVMVNMFVTIFMLKTLLLAKNIEKVKGESFNFGSDETLSILDLIKIVEKNLFKKIKYKILNQPVTKYLIGMIIPFTIKNIISRV